MGHVARLKVSRLSQPRLLLLIRLGQPGHFLSASSGPEAAMVGHRYRYRD